VFGAILLVILGGSTACQSYEIIRVEITPPPAPPATLDSVRSSVAARALCVQPVKQGQVDTIDEAGLETDGVTKLLCRQLEETGVFRSPPVVRGAAGAREAEIAFDLETDVRARPVSDTGIRMLWSFFTIFPPYIIGFANCVWTERDPPADVGVTLHVRVVGGERIATYRASGTGVLYAQHPGVLYDYGDRGASQAAVDRVRDDALASLATQFALDRDAHERIRAATEIDPKDAPELEPLMVSKETAAVAARRRTRLLVQAKTKTLPTVLSERKTGALKDLVVAIETAILDLSHESEAANGRAQDLIAKGGAGAAEERELALALKERIEVWKPVLAAVKDEVKSRER